MPRATTTKQPRSLLFRTSGLHQPRTSKPLVERPWLVTGHAGKRGAQRQRAHKPPREAGGSGIIRWTTTHNTATAAAPLPHCPTAAVAAAARFLAAVWPRFPGARTRLG